MAVGIHKADKPFSENVIKHDVKVNYKRTFLYYHQLSLILENGQLGASGVPRGGVWGVQTPPEIPKISVESSIT